MINPVLELDTLIVPIGGGGLLADVRTVGRHLKPKIQLIGVQTTLYPSMYNLFKAASLPLGGDTLAEGLLSSSLVSLPPQY